jgi:hypothetical protein
MNKAGMYLVGGMGLLIIVLFLIIIFRAPVDKIIPFNDKPYKDTINLLRKDISSIHIENDSLYKSNDSIKNSKSVIINQLHEKIIYLSGATTQQLDDYISSNIN